MIKSWLRSKKTQIPALIALHFFVGFVFWYGIEKLFLANSLGVGPSGIATIVTLYTVLTVLLDVPASVVADRWGRRRMLLIAVGLFIASNIVLGASPDFFVYLVGTVLWALFTVSYEGTYEAMLYDSLKEQKREDAFQKIDAWSRFSFMIGIAISSIASGFIADKLGLRADYFLSILPLVLALVALLTTKEPVVHQDDEVEDVVKRGYFAHLIHAFRMVIRNPKLLLVTFGMVTLFFAQTPMFEFNQYVYIELFKSPVLVGIFGGLAGAVLAVGFFIAIKRTFSPRILLFVVGGAILIAAILANNASVLFLWIALAGGSLLENAYQTKLQHSTTSRTRASVTSAVYFPGNILIIPFVFVFGFVAEHQSIWLAYVLDGGVLLLMALIYFFLSRRVERVA